MGNKEDIDLLKFYLISILSFITDCIITFNLISSIKTIKKFIIKIFDKNIFKRYIISKSYEKKSSLIELS